MAKTPPSRSYRLFSGMVVVSSWYHRRRSSIVLFFTVALHEPVRFSLHMQPKTIAISGLLDVGNRLAPKGLTERYEGLWRSPLKPTTSAMGHFRPVVTE